MNTMKLFTICSLMIIHFSVVSPWFTNKKEKIPEGGLRLVGQTGGIKGIGRVEVYHDSAWGTVCDSNFDIAAARVVCRILGFKGGMPRIRAYFGQGTGNVSLSQFKCDGDENNITECQIKAWGNFDCGHVNDAGVHCDGGSGPEAGDIRLAEGDVKSEGRLEIYHNGEWGTVCSNDWGFAKAKVVCRQLGYAAFKAVARSNSYYDNADDKVWISDPKCVGHETRLDTCEFLGWQGSGCTHKQDTGVECYPVTEDDKKMEGKIRLFGGNRPSEGRVEVFHSGEWGTICDDDFSQGAAEVVCRKAGYSGPATMIKGRIVKPNSQGPIWLKNVECKGDERIIDACEHSGWGNTDCKHEEDIYVECGRALVITSTTVKTTTNQQNSVSKSSPTTSSQIASSMNSVSPSVSSSISTKESTSSTSSTQSNTYSTYSTSRRTYRPLPSSRSTYKPYSSSRSTYRPLSTYRSTYSTYNSITTRETSKLWDIRLLGGETENEGRLEIRENGIWGTVCDDGFNQAAADVVCRMFGYDYGEYKDKSYYGAGYGDILFLQMQCHGDEKDIQDCRYELEEGQCNHGEDIGLSCEYKKQESSAREGDMRLSNGRREGDGRVEIFHDGEWGSICSDSVDEITTGVICKYFGFDRGYPSQWIDRYSEFYMNVIDSPIWLDEVFCAKGDERHILDCERNRWGNNDCRHAEDLVITCYDRD